MLSFGERVFAWAGRPLNLRVICCGGVVAPLAAWFNTQHLFPDRRLKCAHLFDGGKAARKPRIYLFLKLPVTMMSQGFSPKAVRIQRKKGAFASFLAESRAGLLKKNSVPGSITGLTGNGFTHRTSLQKLSQVPQRLCFLQTLSWF